MRSKVKISRRRGAATISSKNQVTIPVDALLAAGLATGDRVRAVVAGPGRIILERDANVVDQFSGALTGVYPTGYLDELRGEWKS
jgi:bifunctional DNA-binding transcriptional regulator/antitoxin component of YhaV-PrlF toxin-antitoxin module